MIKLTYKCRNCGEVTTSTVIPNDIPEMSRANRLWFGIAESYNLRKHVCQKGVIGFSEPIKVEVVEDDK